MRLDDDNISILLVDDREENLLTLEAVLASPGYHFIKANSGDEALRYLLSNNPALILLDVQMPNLNGFETASIIKSNVRTREIPIIFVTAINKEESFIYQGYQNGAVDYIYKPYNPYILKSKVAVFVDIRRHHQRMARLVAVQEATTQALAGPANTPTSDVLKAICNGLGWEASFFWRINLLNNVLECQARWFDPNLPELLRTDTRNNLSPGEGLPGVVWAQQKFLWICRSTSEGIRTSVGIPISINGESLGVLEILSLKDHPEDPDLVKIMRAIGSQICQYLKRTEAIELTRKEEARKSGILEAAVDCVFCMNSDGTLLEFNPAAEATFGYKRSEVIGRKMAEILFPPEVRINQSSQLTSILKRNATPGTKERLEVVAVCSNSNRFPAELAISQVSNIHPPLFTGNLRDITERKRILERNLLLDETTATLSASLDYEQTFLTLAELVVKFLADGCSIDLLDDNGKLRSVAMAHIDPKKLALAKELLETPPDWDTIIGVSSVIRTGKSQIYPNITDEILVKIAANQPHLSRLREFGIKTVWVVPLIAREKILGAVTFVATESRDRCKKDDIAVAEELARRAAIAIDNARLYRDAQVAIRARDEFFFIASHELKAPITSLKLRLQLLQRTIESKSLSHTLESSVAQVDRLANLTERLLDVTKIRTGKLEIEHDEMDLSKLVKDFVERYSADLIKADCLITTNIEAGITGRWDETRMEQILANLLSNATKYAPGTPVVVELKRSESSVVLIVQDFGPGISPDQQMKIFNRFERANPIRHAGGLGLGLYIVKQIIEAHQGKIWLESREGSGSKFLIELPQNSNSNA